MSGSLWLVVTALFQNFEMLCKPQCEVFEDIPIKNSGDVPATVNLTLSNNDSFVLTPDSLEIGPMQKKCVRLAFLSGTLPAVNRLAHWYVVMLPSSLMT